VSVFGTDSVLIRALNPTVEPIALYAEVRKRSQKSFLLESAPGRFAEFSFIGFDPVRIIRFGAGAPFSANPLGAPLQTLRELLVPRASPYKYIGGLVGYISYEFVRHLETLKPSPFPDLELGLFTDGVIYDHRHERAFYFSHGEDRSALVADSVDEAQHRDEPKIQFACAELRSDCSQAEFELLVARARERIASGEIFQIVLSRQLTAPYQGDLFAVYQRLRTINPSPYMYFLDFGDRTIAGSSPEMLVAVHDRTVLTYPIAGTRPLGRSEDETAALARELRADPKECAEHVMLVDLARNDVGRISEFGSVRVPEYMSVERFSHVQHLVSRVEGRLREGLDALDALAALFPAGTVSGAPKVRTMELIAQLEKTARGPYAGAVGYLSFNGNLDMAITIRTIWADKKNVYTRAGAGIVHDSVPEREWLETESKLHAMKNALQGGAPL
jgi:anthranilate synthase component 1